ncbi:MAG: translation elongation factor Ts [Clostridia bacterium]|nr:translation elongation factor Ts [Clostridia bacterium]
MAAVTAAMVKELREITGAGMMDCKKALVETEGDIDKAIDVLREKGLSKAAKKAGRIAAEGLVDLAFNADHTQAAVVEVNSETDFVSKNEEFRGFVTDLAELALTSDAADIEAFKALSFKDEGTVEEALTQKISKIGENMNIRRFEKVNVPGTVNVGYIHGNGRIAVIVSFKTDAAFAEIETMGKDVAMQVASMNPKFLDESAIGEDFIASEKEVLLQQALNENAESAKPKPQEIVEKMVTGRLKKELKELCLVEQKFVKDNDVTVAQYIENSAKAIGKDVAIVGMIRYEVGEGIEKKEENFAEEVAKQQAAAKN